MTVDALTTKMLDCQSYQTAHSRAQNNRSAGVSLGRFTSAGEYRVDGGERGSQAAAPPGSGRKRRRQPTEPTIGVSKEIEGGTATPSLSIRSEFARTTDCSRQYTAFSSLWEIRRADYGKGTLTPLVGSLLETTEYEWCFSSKPGPKVPTNLLWASVCSAASQHVHG